MNHKYHAPMTGITSTAQNSVESYSKLTDAHSKHACLAETTLKISHMLDVFDANLFSSLSKLSRAGYELKLEHIDFKQFII